MKKLRDERLLRLAGEFMNVHLPEQRVCSGHTIKSYKDTLNLLFRFLQTEKSMSLFDVTFETLNPQMISDFLNWLEDGRGCKITTRNQRFSAIRSFFNYAAKMDITLSGYQNELRKISVKKNPEPSGVKFLSETALKALFDEPDTSKPKEFRNLFFMVLLYDSGARDSELLQIKLKDVDLTPRRAKIHVIGKWGKPRSIPIMDKTANHCSKYLSLFHADVKDGGQYLFYTVRHGQKQRMSDDNVARFMKSYGEAAKVKCQEIPARVHPHLFRHTRAMHLYQGGMPLALISEWLGHANPETTLIYAHADAEMKRKAIQNAVAQSNPLNSPLGMPNNWENDEELLLTLYGLK